MSSEGSGGKGHVVGAWARHIIVWQRETGWISSVLSEGVFLAGRMRDAVNGITHQLVVMSSEPTKLDAITLFPCPFQMDLGPLHPLSL